MGKLQKAIFAGGCFWCMIKPFDKYEGVKSVLSGYTGGYVENPTYEQIKTQTTGHREAVEITFDEDKISFEMLVDIFFKVIDPTDEAGQFIDRGESYTTAVFYQDENQRDIVERYIKELDASGKFSKPVVTKVLPAMPFYLAEEYHQDYYKKNPDAYQKEYIESGRADFIKQTWTD
ncbi:peptide-methionine (S)-S-oxide reductase MsrA [Zhenhengia yiwuensis]|uniref:Peptide methionine sulfoxide reductase MsrA n=1 Tax=Zhenhengia yiwuensis TaxID=2763666 RepID=A0A926IEF1_9FIRM|nr:peptide-methionine (S)-S-oxide reductase MsrA [Zhenhengia yiwuensis]MBC8579864.1 peptide-methionine (S)-S-oxide reductase MsrA [Zhenhengia yiwuensis]MBS5801300.1 peptide-methionine (S)-S-oxide reductase MsrA [Clostridiales bacterium]